MSERGSLNIVVVGRARSTIADEIRAIAPGAAVSVIEPQDMADVIAEADIVATVRLPPEMLGRATRLKWVQGWAAGPNELMHDAMRESDVVVTSCKGNGAIPLAEHGMLMMLMLDRQVPRLVKAQAERRWDKFQHGELNGRTVGIIGTGHSGTDLARKAKAFYMRVIGVRRQDRPAANFDEIYPRRRLHDFLAASDFVVATAPLTEETRGMLGEAEFRAMKPTAFYICFSRGALADTDALLKALEEGWIAGAGLDAHAVEPLPSDSPFWSMPNVIVTPHAGAVSQGTIDRGNDIFLENLRRFLAGEPMVNLVDKSAGY